LSFCGHGSSQVMHFECAALGRMRLANLHRAFDPKQSGVHFLERSQINPAVDQGDLPS
jgi:hypothetical protein